MASKKFVDKRLREMERISSSKVPRNQGRVKKLVLEETIGQSLIGAVRHVELIARRGAGNEFINQRVPGPCEL
jgi:hypothetical protein